MELSFLLTLFAFVTSLQFIIVQANNSSSTNAHGLESVNTDKYRIEHINEEAECDISSEDCSENDTWRPAPDPKFLEKFKKKQNEARLTTSGDLHQAGYPETGISFNSVLEENVYFYNKYPNLSERKYYQYRNSILRQRFSEEETDPGHGVIGGNNTSIEKHPFVGGLGYKFKKNNLEFLCGCSLISHYFALTAAHCTLMSHNNVLRKPSIVRFGSTTIYTSGYDYIVSEVIQYPQYQLDQQHDIGLVRVQKRIEFNKSVQPACLWRSEDTSSLTHISVTGWGTKDPDVKSISNELQSAELEIIGNTICQKIYQNHSQPKDIGNGQICAGTSSGGVDACKGDSGGPLEGFWNGVTFIVGIVAKGNGCALSNIPGIYTRVSTYVSWIEGEVWGDRD